ncbi:hypothetical protein MLD38_009003 [Melastoma candidum]|uniref:Uncharacterized protein n=1 Tax=Melastoma candidum TaxID=119954 RepID=A0ACB9RVV3_9MYRT|nr:hypothetical protein MLD38_009003 [Melastoma candidum]
MASGFSGGGPDLYGSTGGGFATRSIASASSPTLQPQPFRSQNQLPGILLEPYPSSLPHHQQQHLQQQQQLMQPPPQTPTALAGKRSLVDFQSHPQHVRNQVLNSLLMRYVKPRIYQQASPVSPLQSLDFSPALPSSPDLMSLAGLSSAGGQPSQRYRIPLLQQMRPQPISLGSGMIQPGETVPMALPGVPFANTRQSGAAVRPENENGMKDRLQELEKQLLDDDDEPDDGNAASAITNGNSEWSDTIQCLMVETCQGQKQISPSLTSSSSSSSPSSSLSVASPVTACSKQTILEAASAIYEGKNDVAAEILARTPVLTNPGGNWEQKLMTYMLCALKSRLNPTDNPPPTAELFAEEHVLSTQLLYDLSPCFKLGFMAANLAILEAFLEPQSTNKLHVIDFDIGQGGQYVNLLHALAGRQSNRPSVLKITTVSDNGGDERLRLVGEALNQQATKVGIGLQFRIVNGKLADLNGETLGCEADEVLAVNFAFKLYRIPDESISEDNPRDFLLRRVKSLSPRVVTLVEQEWNANTAPFLTRVNEAIGYYGALLDSIESTVSKDHLDRIRVEEGLGRKLGNSVACEGRERVERCEVFGKWRARMGMAGFAAKPMKRQVAESMRARLQSKVGRSNPGFTVKEESGGVGFGWHGRTLTVASAWR